MTNENKGKKIDETIPGDRTGETIYIDEDGGQWTDERSPYNDCKGTTGCIIGRLVVDRIYPERHYIWF